MKEDIICLVSKTAVLTGAEGPYCYYIMHSPSIFSYSDSDICSMMLDDSNQQSQIPFSTVGKGTRLIGVIVATIYIYKVNILTALPSMFRLHAKFSKTTIVKCWRKPVLFRISVSTKKVG